MCDIGEDILTGIITDVEYLAKWCKGENKSVAMNLLEKIRQMEIQVQSALEYHKEKVASAIECLDNIQGYAWLIIKTTVKDGSCVVPYTVYPPHIPHTPLATAAAFDDCKGLSLIQKIDN